MTCRSLAKLLVHCVTAEAVGADWPASALVGSALRRSLLQRLPVALPAAARVTSRRIIPSCFSTSPAPGRAAGSCAHMRLISEARRGGQRAGSSGSGGRSPWTDTLNMMAA